MVYSHIHGLFRRGAAVAMMLAACGSALLLSTTTASAVVLSSCNTEELCNEAAEPVAAGPGGDEQIAFDCDALVTADALTVTSTSVQCTLVNVSTGVTAWSSPIQNCISVHCSFTGTSDPVVPAPYKFCVQATWLPTGGNQLAWGQPICSTSII